MENSFAQSRPSNGCDKFEKMRKVAGVEPGELRSQLRASCAVVSPNLEGMPTQSTVSSLMVTISSNTNASVTCTISNVQANMICTPTYTDCTTVTTSICPTTPYDNGLPTPLSSLPNKPSKAKCPFQAHDRTVNRKRKGVSQPPLPILTPSPSRKTKRQATMPLNEEASTSTAAALNNNRFALLSAEAENMEQDVSDADSDIEDSAARDGGGQSAKYSKPPAICVPSVSDPVTLERALNLSIGSSNYYIRTSRFGVSRIYTANSDAFRTAVKELNKLNCQFWHHQLKEEKPYRVVLKGIHANVPSSQIEQAFSDHGYEVLNIYCPRKSDWKNIQVNEDDNEATKNFKTRQNLFYINLKQGPNVKESLKITRLGRYRVTVERATRRKELLQCQRCQIFGHSKNYCAQDPICGKCSGPHMTGSALCISDVCLCINCGGDHVSTDKSCPVRAEKAKKLKPRSRLPMTNNIATLKPPQRSSSGYIPAEALRTNISYADIARRNTTQSRARATVQAEVIPTSDNSLNNKFMTLDNSIRAINTRMDELFKLIHETVEANKAFRELVQVLITRIPK